MARNATFGAVVFASVVVFASLLVTSSLSGVVGITAMGAPGVATGTTGAATGTTGMADASSAPPVQETITTQDDGATTQEDRTQDNETTTQDDGTVNETATITFGDQPSDGAVVVVNESALSAGGFVLVFDQNGTVLGNSSYLESGTHENVTVELDTPVGRSQVLFATPHLDTDENRTLDFNATRATEVGVENVTDRPYLNPEGLPVGDVAFVTVGNATERGTTTTAGRVAPAE